MPDDSTSSPDNPRDEDTTELIDAVDDNAVNDNATGDSAGDAASGDAAGATASDDASRSEKLEKQNRRFTRWRKQRPFGAGLLMILAGIAIMAPAYLSLEISNIQIQISTMGGVSTLVIGHLQTPCALMCPFRGEGRVIAGVAAMILSVLSLWQTNFGGLIIGLILGLVGGALALAWDPQSREDAKDEKRQKKEAKQARKAEKSGKGAANAKPVIAVLAALAVGVGIQTPDARAQIPGLPDIQLPDLQIPGQTGNGDGDTDGETNNSPALPNLPELPEVPDLNLPELTLPDGNQLQDGIDGSLESLGVEIPGLNVAPPEPVANMRPPYGDTFTIKTDNATMTPGMKLSYVTIDTVQGPKKAIRIDADQAVMENLRVQFPNSLGPDLLDDTKGNTSTLTGNFHIFVQELTMTLELLGVDTMIPITINADWAPDDIAAELSKIGLGLPDLLSEQTRVLDVRLETYQVMADKMDFPVTDIGPWHEN
ncbi:DUF6114 domain-containing protein [Corynebacterium sp. AOP12-C2-36]|uniref:DUF6114 domain-containing protein n=1 Tax=Corynebacterium sp. AOP12-C2-36 TaxID=3457723 RepID=UPI004034E3CA